MVQRFGLFKSVTRTSIGITIIAEPELDGALVITDLLISTNEQKDSLVEVNFIDGTNSVNIVTGDVSSGPLSITITFIEKRQGWKNARIELKTVGRPFNANVSIGYIKVSTGLDFDDWDSLR